MAQRKPNSIHEEPDEARLERLRNDPNVIIHHGSGTPFVQERWAKDGVDVLWLIGRTDDDDEDEVRGGGR